MIHIQAISLFHDKTDFIPSAKSEFVLPIAGQTCWLQSSLSQCLPSHFLPGCTGFGFVHVRDLCLSPPLHVIEQVDHSSHAAHIPSTPIIHKSYWITFMPFGFSNLKNDCIQSSKSELDLPRAGQICWLQSFVSQFLPSHFLPGCMGFGFVHVRDLCLSPPLHVLEQVDHPPQSDHIPSTPNTHVLQWNRF